MIQQKTKKIQAENVFIWSFKHIDFKKCKRKALSAGLRWFQHTPLQIGIQTSNKNELARKHLLENNQSFLNSPIESKIMDTFI